MADFIKVVSGIYLVFVWLAFIIVAHTGARVAGSDGSILLAFLMAVAASLPAVILFGFGQLIENTREMVRLLRTMQPQATLKDPQSYKGFPYDVQKNGTVVVQTSDGPVTYSNWNEFSRAVGP